MSKPRMTMLMDLNDMIAGFQADLPTTVKGITVTGKTLTPAQVVSLLTGYLPPFTNADQAKTVYVKAVADRKAIQPDVQALLVGLRVFLKQLFPGDVATLAKFGVIVTPRAKATAINKALAVSKQQATRKKNQPATPAAPQARVVLFGADGNPVEPLVSTAGASAPTAASVPTVAPAAAVSSK